MSATTFVTPEKARKYFNVSDNTLRKWDLEGKIETNITSSKPIIKEKICFKYPLHL